MSESNLYALLYFDEISQTNEADNLLQGPNLDPVFKKQIEAISASDNLISVSLFGGDIIPTDALKSLKFLNSNAMLITVSTETGSASRYGYIENKKLSYAKAEEFIANKSKPVEFLLTFRNGARKDIENLLENGFDLSTLPEGNNILWNCDFRFQAPLLVSLINYGANVNQISPERNRDWSEFGCTPLIEAATWKKVEIIEALLKHGADVHYKNPKRQSTPLHYAVSDDSKSRKICGMLIEAGADVNAQSADGRTPVMGAINQHSDKGSLTTVKFFEKRGADLGIYSAKHGNLAWMASQHNNTVVLDYLSSKGFEPIPPSEQ